MKNRNSNFSSIMLASEREVELPLNSSFEPSFDLESIEEKKT